jgi:hypothetical protein
MNSKQPGTTTAEDERDAYAAWLAACGVPPKLARFYAGCLYGLRIRRTVKTDDPEPTTFSITTPPDADQPLDVAPVTRVPRAELVTPAGASDPAPNVRLVDGPHDGRRIFLPIAEPLSNGQTFTARSVVVGTPQRTEVAEYRSYSNSHDGPGPDGLHRFFFHHLLTEPEIEDLCSPSPA